MNLPKAYIGGFQKAIKLPRMLFIVYFANFITALILALTFNGVLKESFGNSGILSNLIHDFDYTTYSNLMFNHGDAISAVLGGVKWLLIAYFLMSIFLTGGIIETFNKNKFTTSSFFGGSAYNFFRLLGLSLIMVFVQIIFLIVVYLPLSLILKSVLKDMTSEVTLYYFAVGGFVLHLLIFLLISMIGDYAKLYLVLNDSFNVFKGFWNGVKYVFKNFLKTYFLYLFLLFLPAVIMYLYLYLERDIKMATGIGILIVFGMQQAFMLLRVFLRVWVLSSQFQIYNDDFVKLVNQKAIVFSVVDSKTNTEKELIETPVKTTSKEPVKEEIPIIKEEVKTEYAIDFSKTFTSVDEEDNNEDQTITEEEMLKKVMEEEISLADENSITSEDETNIIVEKEEDVIDSNLITATDEKEAVDEKVEELTDSNLITAEDETDNTDEKEEVQIEEEVTKNTDESEIVDEKEMTTDIEKVEQNVLNLEDESGEEIDKEKSKKSSDDMIEFDL